MAALAIITTALIALATWFVTQAQAQARRATRRNMRINYLLDAYRRLDGASNRQLAEATARDLEAAISDIILLGSPHQARLAEDFARMFAAERDADTQPILQDLRQSLRKELLLERLPTASYVSLRLDLHGDRVSEQSRIWRETAQTTRQAVSTELDRQRIASPQPGMPPADPAAPAEQSFPSATIDTSAQQVERALAALIGDPVSESVPALSLDHLTSRALQLGLIDAKLAESLNGLSVMHLLARTGPHRPTESQAAEFASLSISILYLLGVAARARNSGVLGTRHRS